MLGLCFCARAFSSCGERRPLFIAVCGPLTVAASLVEEHRLQTHKLSNCGSRAQLLRGMWDLPRPGLEPVSPVLVGRFSTTAPPGKPLYLYFYGPLFPSVSHRESWCIAVMCWYIYYSYRSLFLFVFYGGFSINVCWIEFTWIECNIIEAIQSSERISHT